MGCQNGQIVRRIKIVFRARDYSVQVHENDNGDLFRTAAITMQIVERFLAQPKQSFNSVLAFYPGTKISFPPYAL
jgi:hypothetical protein